jgi:hypothetical protein
VIRSNEKSLLSIYFRHFILLLIIVTIASCSKKNLIEKPVDPGPDDTIPTPESFKNGIFIVNEGNYNWGNASISFINSKDSLVNKDVFQQVNKRSLGDVAESMKIFNNKGFIIVNNSNTIEVVSLDDFKSVASINGFDSPRNIEFIDSTKAYVTNMFKDISVVDLKTFKITKTIRIEGWTESMLRYNDYIFVTCVGTFNVSNAKRKAKIEIISTRDDRVVDSINSGKEPMGIVIDKKKKIWVLCTGGFDNYEAASIIRIDPDLKMIEKVFAFTLGKDTPSRFCINHTGDTLYYLNNGIYKMPVSSSSLPEQPFVRADGHLFYGLGISPKGNIFVSDAVDYVQDGWVYQYDQSNGTLLKSYRAGRIPGSFCFTEQ